MNCLEHWLSRWGEKGEFCPKRHKALSQLGRGHGCTGEPSMIKDYLAKKSSLLGLRNSWSSYLSHLWESPSLLLVFLSTAKQNLQTPPVYYFTLLFLLVPPKALRIRVPRNLSNPPENTVWWGRREEMEG